MIITSRSLIKRGSIPQSIRRAEAAPPGRIESWVTLIQRADQETYYKWQLSQPLSELIVAVLAHHERLTPKQIREKLATESLELPPELQVYLQASMTSFSHLLAPRSRFRTGPQPSSRYPRAGRRSHRSAPTVSPGGAGWSKPVCRPSRSAQ